MTDEGRTFATTETSFAVIHAIEDADGATFTELRSRLDLSKSSLYYHLTTLEKLGYVVKKESTYQLGLRFLSHAEHAKRKEPAFDVVRLEARDFADRIPEEISFATEENGRLLTVGDIDNLVVADGSRGAVSMAPAISSVIKSLLTEDTTRISFDTFVMDRFDSTAEYNLPLITEPPN